MHAILCAVLLLLGTGGSASALGGFFNPEDKDKSPGGHNACYEPKSTGERVDNYTVPEPPTMLLLGTGLVGLAGIMRRRIKKN